MSVTPADRTSDRQSTELSCFDRVVEVIEDHTGKAGRMSGGRVQLLCPAHYDQNASLSVAEGDDGRVLVKCFAGCTAESITAAIGLRMADLFPAEGREFVRLPVETAKPEPPPFSADVEGYRAALLGDDQKLDQLDRLRGWTRDAIESLGVGFDGERVTFPCRDASGVLVGLGRYAPDPTARGDEPKMLMVPGSRRGLFPAPETITEGDDHLWLLEGEADAVRAHSLGLAAVTHGGVENWHPEYAARFAGRRVVICLDSDEPGRKAARRIRHDLVGVAAEVRLLDLDATRNDGYDLSDFAADAKTAEERAQVRGRLEQMAYDVPGESKMDGSAIPGVICAADVRRANVDWLVHGLVPLGALTMLAGDPGLGKSMYTCALAAQLSRDLLAGGGASLFVTAEDALAETLRPRLEAADADLDRIYFADDSDTPIELPGSVAYVDERLDLIERTGDRVRLLVLDPFNAFLPGRVNSWSDQSVRTALRPLRDLAERRGMAVLIVLHLNKAQGGEALYRVGGSIGYVGAARSVLLLARDPDDADAEHGNQRVLAHLKCNLAPLAESRTLVVEGCILPADEDGEAVSTARIVESGLSPHGASTLLASRGESEPGTPSEAADFLRGELAFGSASVRTLRVAAEAHGIGWRTVERAKRDVGVEARKIGLKGGWEWYLPLSEPDPPKAAKPAESDALLDVGGLRTNPVTEPKTAVPATEGRQGRHIPTAWRPSVDLTVELPGDVTPSQPASEAGSGDLAIRHRAVTEPSHDDAGPDLVTDQPSLPGDAGYRDMLNRAYESGQITTRQRHELRLEHYRAVKKAWDEQFGVTV